MTDFEAEQFVKLKQENTRLRELAQTLVDALHAWSTKDNRSGHEVYHPDDLPPRDHSRVIQCVIRALSQAKASGIVPKEG